MRRGALGGSDRVCLASGGGGERVRLQDGASEALGRLGAGLALAAMIVVWLAVLPFATMAFLTLHLLSAFRGNERLRTPRREG